LEANPILAAGVRNPECDCEKARTAGNTDALREAAIAMAKRVMLDILLDDDLLRVVILLWFCDTAIMVLVL